MHSARYCSGAREDGLTYAPCAAYVRIDPCVVECCAAIGVRGRCTKGAWVGAGQQPPAPGGTMLHEGLESLNPSSPCRGHGSLDLSWKPPRGGRGGRGRGIVESWGLGRPVWVGRGVGGWMRWSARFDHDDDAAAESTMQCALLTSLPARVTRPWPPSAPSWSSLCCVVGTGAPVSVSRKPRSSVPSNRASSLGTRMGRGSVFFFFCLVLGSAFWTRISNQKTHKLALNHRCANGRSSCLGAGPKSS